MGSDLLALIGPRSSTGWPMTFMIRPSTSRPTGTWIDAPVFSTGIPRTRPSVVSMAMQRTLRSPRCCATSTTRLPGLSLIDGFEIRSAVLISGRSPPANSTSTTGPMTWTTFPWVVA